MSETTIIPFTTTGMAPNHVQPMKAHHDDAAFDLLAAEDFTVFSRRPRIVATGVRLAIPEGFAGLVLPRSGLAFKHAVTVLNSPGLIDPGYRGEVGVVLFNHGIPDYTGARGDRIAQLLIVRTADVRFSYFSTEFTEGIFTATERGEGGFGSTGR